MLFIFRVLQYFLSMDPLQLNLSTQHIPVATAIATLWKLHAIYL